MFELFVRVANNNLQYTQRNMHTVFALLCFVVVIHWLIFPYPSGLLYWHCGNLTIAPVPAKQLWWIWINTSCEFIMDDYITTTKQSTTKPCAYFLGYTVFQKQQITYFGWYAYHTFSLDIFCMTSPSFINFPFIRLSVGSYFTWTDCYVFVCFRTVFISNEGPATSTLHGVFTIQFWRHNRLCNLLRPQISVIFVKYMYISSDSPHHCGG